MARARVAPSPRPLSHCTPIENLLLAGALIAAACSAPSGESTSHGTSAATGVGTPGAAPPTTPITSPMPAAQLAAVKAALPKVGWPRLQALFADAHTYWYDATSMQPSYQETGSPGGGARDNADWHDLIANTGSSDPNSNPAVGAAAVVYDEAGQASLEVPGGDDGGGRQLDELHHGGFPSICRSTVGGNIVPIPISTASDSLHLWWQWQFPNGTIVGEVLFITSGTTLLPCEVRFRQRFPSGWATNVFRPFPEAASLSAAIKSARPAWATTPALTALVAQLDGTAGFTPLTLTATGLTGSFNQAGYLDELPDFGDDDLVVQLLTTTTFVAAYDAVWRQSADQTQQAFAAATATNNPPSIVPNNFQAGLIQVNETSCTRCHELTGQELGNYYPGLTLYGDVWGTDNVFSFHVFDESYYPDLDLDTGSGVQDNRHQNPALLSMGMIKQFDAATDTQPPYYNRHMIPPRAPSPSPRSRSSRGRVHFDRPHDAACGGLLPRCKAAAADRAAAVARRRARAAAAVAARRAAAVAARRAAAGGWAAEDRRAAAAAARPAAAAAADRAAEDRPAAAAAVEAEAAAEGAAAEE